MHRDVNLRINRVKIVEHFHLLFEIGHGFAAVFGHDEVDADDALGIGGNGFESEKRLREDLLIRKTAKNLVDESLRDVASGLRVGLPAVSELVARLFRLGEKCEIVVAILLKTLAQLG